MTTACFNFAAKRPATKFSLWVTVLPPSILFIYFSISPGKERLRFFLLPVLMERGQSVTLSCIPCIASLGTY